MIARSVGDTTDIVSKEMYDFYDKGERHVTLRPEGTAIARSYVENKLFGPEHTKPYKVFYMGPMFRYERPQKAVCVNSTKSVSKFSVQQIQRPMLRQWRWQWIFIVN